MINDQADINRLLTEARVIALVGASAKTHRDSYRVMFALKERGYRVIPVNPRMAGEELLGETVYGSLADLPCPVDFVDLFINAEAAGEIIDEAIALNLPAVWMQLGVINEEAASRAAAAGLQVVMNRCPLMEFAKQDIPLPV